MRASCALLCLILTLTIHYQVAFAESSPSFGQQGVQFLFQTWVADKDKASSACPTKSGSIGFVQSDYFNKGNFEVVVPLASGGLAHFWRDNDSPNLLWHGPYIFGTNAGKVDAVSLIQSNFFRQGNFEVIARIGDHLVHFWRDNDDPHIPIQYLK